MNARLSVCLLIAGGALAAAAFGPETRAEGLVAHSAERLQGSRVAGAGQRTFVADGQGRVAGSAGSGFSTAAGGQGLRSTQFQRSADGAIGASGQATATAANGGSAQRSSSYTRNTDGSASAERSTSATNANTGVSFNGAARYTKGEGVSRSGGCSDAAGNSVSCGAR